jgi:NAD(P)-dependent dehydrogenase (short-subunit alcohol dehydrogenase family)|tara:strand:- start:554 stop:730 length:177 start_codon:yes stop_codon:yes gene_type:complete
VDLENKVAVITGGASGLGRATGEEMVLANGVRVAIFDLNQELAEQSGGETGTALAPTR